MEIEKNYSILKACRFCPMCKHLCSSGNLTMHESDYPRGRGLIMYRIYKGEDFNPDYVNSLYNCFMCGCCLAGCEGNFDLPVLIKSARADIVLKKLEPGLIKNLKNNLIEKENIYGLDFEDSFTYKNESLGTPGGDIVYIAGHSVNYKHFEIAQASLDLFIKARLEFSLISREPDCGKVLSLLGYANEAKEASLKFAKKINSMKIKKLVTSDPMVLDCILNDFKAVGAEINSGVEIMHFSEFADSITKNPAISFKKYNKKITVADSEFLCKKNNRCENVRNLIKKIAPDSFVELFRNKKEAYATGEAAFYQNGSLFRGGKELVRKISNDAAILGIKTMVTLSGTAKENLTAAAKKQDIEVIDISEFLIKSL